MADDGARGCSLIAYRRDKDNPELRPEHTIGYAPYVLVFRQEMNNRHKRPEYIAKCSDGGVPGIRSFRNGSSGIG